MEKASEKTTRKLRKRKLEEDIEMKMKLGKKGQVEMTESLLVLLIIVFLIIIGFFVYYSFFYKSLGSLGREKSDVENLILLHNFASLPEIKCENEDCVDVLKLLSFKELADENKGYYIGIFNDRNVIVENIYPEIKDEVEDVECTLSKYQQSNFPENCGYFSIYGEIKDKEQSYSISLPVSLYFANLNQYRLGLVKIRNGD